jgi:hypothetical protein
MLLFVDLLEPSILFIGGVEIWAHSTWDVKAYSPFTKGFDVLMVTFYIDPLGVGTNRLSSGQGTIPPQLENNPFTSTDAFEHIITPNHPLPSCQ